MAAQNDYLSESQTPTRADVDKMQGLVLLEFGTPWCGYCKALAPYVAQLLERDPQIQHIKVEDGAGRLLGRSYEVRLWPNFVFQRDGVVVAQLARPGKAELDQAFGQLLGI